MMIQWKVATMNKKVFETFLYNSYSEMTKTHRLNFLKKWGLPPDTSLSLEDISTLSNIPIEALQMVYNRGVGAWKTNIESVRLKKDFSKNPDLKTYPRSSRLGKENWAFARVFSFIDKGKTYKTADKDIAEHFGV